MARFSLDIETGGRPVNKASVSVWDEDAGVAEGNEDAGFNPGMERSIWSDNAMATLLTQPILSDSNGDVVFFLPSMSKIAIKVTRAGFGTRWYRHIDVTGTDPI
ncbi:MAG: hypothetical protein E2O95_04200 [Acidobacteria bacterium]|nr:MAG: hypothetical protein E2O95_04200 [Acidobacteriota bacterium]